MDHEAPKAGRPGRSVAGAIDAGEYRSAATGSRRPIDAGVLDDEDDLDIDRALPAATPLAADDIRRFDVDAARHGSRLDRALAGWIPEHSRSHLQTLVAQGAVSVDGRCETGPAHRLTIGQAVVVRLVQPASHQPFQPEPMALDVRWEDEHLLVLCKPAGLVVHPAAGNWQGTLLNGLLARDAVAAGLPRAGIVHRLDKDTSGLMIVARSTVAMTGLVRAIAAREVHRAYRAIVHGVLPDTAMSLDAPIGRDPRVRVRMAAVASGREARTDVRRVASDGRHSAVECTLHTGRTHQIRVHLSHAGHPLVADLLYGGAPALDMRRQALHAFQLRLRHPVDGREIAVEARPPADFEAAWQAVLDTAGVTARGPGTGAFPGPPSGRGEPSPQARTIRGKASRS